MWQERTPNGWPVGIPYQDPNNKPKPSAKQMRTLIDVLIDMYQVGAASFHVVDDEHEGFNLVFRKALKALELKRDLGIMVRNKNKYMSILIEANALIEAQGHFFLEKSAIIW